MNDMQRRGFLRTGLTVGATALSAPAVVPLFGGTAGSGTFVHCVYFWLKEELTDEQLATFEGGLDSLVAIDTVRHGFYGTPAGTDRPIIERSYTYALVVVFDNEEGHDAYQVAEDHDVFRETFGDFWTDVKIYDFVVG